MEIVADTHALIWYVSGDKKLALPAKNALDNGAKGHNKLIVSLVVLMEALVLSEKRKIPFTVDDLSQKIALFPNAIIYPIGIDVFGMMQRIDRKLELHDRIIVATARIHNASLISADKEIQSFGGVPIIW